MFLVSSEEIQRLSDEQARELVARFVRSEAEKLDAVGSSVTWGGDQRAKDGGIDVRFKSTALAENSSYLPKHCVGDQVKAEKFQPSKISGEMAPAGTISASIAKLLPCNQAYIIVSTKESASDSALAARTSKMAECAKKGGVGWFRHARFLRCSTRCGLGRATPLNWRLGERHRCRSPSRLAAIWCMGIPRKRP